MVEACVNCSDTSKREYCSSLECNATDQTACTNCHYCEACNTLLLHTNGDNPNRKAGW